MCVQVAAIFLKIIFIKIPPTSTGLGKKREETKPGNALYEDATSYL